MSLSIEQNPVVVKIGGAALERVESLHALAGEIAALRRAGCGVVVVHGGGHVTTRTAERLGLASSFIDGVRVTDAEQLAVAVMTLVGTMNTSIVGALRAGGVEAVGVNGLLGAVPCDDSRLGYVGAVQSVDTGVLGTLLGAGVVPVLSPLALDPSGAPLNVNADTAAGAVAAALDASALLLVSDVSGVVVDGAVAPLLDAAAVRSAIASGQITGGMIPKVTAALDVLDSGVRCVRILDAEPGTLRSAVLNNIGGTVLFGAPESLAIAPN